MKHKLHERMGSFVIRRDDLDALPDWVQQMMARVIVLKADYAPYDDGIRYIALCPDFFQTKPGYQPRTYSAIVEDGRFLRFE